MIFKRTLFLTSFFINCRKSCALSMSGMSTYKPGTYSVAYVTVPDETLAKKLAKGLVEQKLAACVNIIPKVTSIYEWKGEINEDSELLMMIKTRSSRIDEMVEFVRENHSYEVCEVITLPIENGNPPYLKWLGDVVPEADKCKKKKDHNA